MRQIRLRWRLQRDDLFGDYLEGDWLWIEDTPANRASFEALVELGNARHGPATHWLEESVR